MEGIPNAKEWSITEVCEWANKSCYSPNTLTALSRNKIDGDTLINLTANDIREELRIESLKERQRLLKDIDVLRGFSEVYENESNELYISMKIYFNNPIAGIEQKIDEQEEHNLNFIENLQLKEIAIFENRLDDHSKASELQSYFNVCMLREQEDSEIARTIDNLNDATARSRLQLGLNNMSINEERRKAENEVIINSIGKDDIFDETADETRFARKFSNMLLINPPIVQSTGTMECIACSDEVSERKSIRVTCGHRYCEGCLEDWFTKAADDVSFLPLQCCRQPVTNPKTLAKKYLNKAKADKLIAAIDEKDCVNKMYCPNNACSLFIDLDQAEESTDFQHNFNCKNCGTGICFNCHCLQHDGSISCDQNRINRERDDEATMEAITGFGYQRCNACKNVVELIYGCNHMTCSCRHEFCYSCGADWVPRKCVCDLIDIGRLRIDEDRNIPANIIGDDRVRLLNRRVKAARGGMIAEENCTNEYKN